MRLSLLLAAAALPSLVACRSAGLVRDVSSTPAPGEPGGDRTIIEPYAGGFRAKLFMELPPASIDYEARRDGRVVRIDLREGYYTAKCVSPYWVVIDVGPLEPGDYAVVVWVSSPWMKATQILETRAAVPTAAAQARPASGSTSVRAGGC